MAHFHRCRFDMQPDDTVTVRDDGVTIEAAQSWIDLGCTDSFDANRLSVAFAQLAYRLAQDEAVEVCIRCDGGEPFVLTPGGERLCAACAADDLRDASVGEVVT